MHARAKPSDKRGSERRRHHEVNFTSVYESEQDYEHHEASASETSLSEGYKRGSKRRRHLQIIKMQKSELKKNKFYLVITLLAISFLSFSGCASVPTQEALPTYYLNGTSYLSLASLCRVRGLESDFDVLTRRITLSKDAHRINLLVGERLVLVDGLTYYLDQPVDMYKGEAMVPENFAARILDALFKKSPGRQKGKAAFPNIRKVVIDAGHGGHDPGAIGRSGLEEKEVTLDIARKLGQLFSENGIEVVMTRTHDIFISPEQRAEIANRCGADIFFSIHANANRVRWLNGFEVYYISSYIDDEKRAMKAAQSRDLTLDKALFSYGSLNLKATLWDMLYTYNRAQSISLAYSLCESIKRSLNVKVLGIKGAGFAVLRGTQMPAVLIEVGFISNNDEERLLKNSFYRQQLADAIFQGTRDYTRQPGPAKFVQR